MAEPNWKNRTIFTGDCLPIMRGMNSATVDLIYLDPPFNSNHNYAAPIGSKAAGAAFKDTWTLDEVDADWLDVLAIEAPALRRILLAVERPSDKAYLVYMAVRLLEMRRLLTPTGSIWLHCDPTMSHYLKVTMDCIYGRANFRNEVIWKRTSAHNDARRFGAVHDVLLHYAASDATVCEVPYLPYDEEYVAKRYKHKDADGRRWMDDNLTAKGLSGGGYEYEYKGVASLWRVPVEKMRELDAGNRLYFTKRGGIRVKRYLDEMRGVPAPDLWTDIAPVNSRAKERTGYPTQKPTALLSRIIEASSNEGGMVLDPFCGCATAPVVADALNRQWCGIDISAKAAELVRERINDITRQIVHRDTNETGLPRRTDLGRLPAYNCKANRDALYASQNSLCGGCGDEFLPRHLEVDHIVALADGGTHHLSNLQLLCANCNRRKGNRGMAYLRRVLGIDGGAKRRFWAEDAGD